MSQAHAHLALKTKTKTICIFVDFGTEIKKNSVQILVEASSFVCDDGRGLTGDMLLLSLPICNL